MNKSVVIFLKSETAANRMFNDFKKRFPNIKSNIEVKTSKYHKTIARLTISNLNDAQLGFISTIVYGY